MNRRIYHRIKIYCEQHQIFSEGDKVLLGVSGGADSVFLVYLMNELGKEWNLSLALVHVNHGIRGAEADRDEAFCCELAKRMGISISVFHGNVPELARQKHLSEEEAGREYRYCCMETAREEMQFDKIAVAHHRDDQAETVLFQMLRGSSLKGLGGMRPVRGQIVRPLLVVSRQEIESELLAMGAEWCEDSTNQEDTYVRNRLRHQVIPYLEEQVAPGAVSHLAETAGQLQEVFDFIAEETDRLWDELAVITAERVTMPVEKFGKAHPVLQRELAMKMLVWAAGGRKDITGRHIHAICELAEGMTGKRISLPYQVNAGKDYDIFWLEKQAANPSSEESGLKQSYQSSEERIIYENLIWNPQTDQRREYEMVDSTGKRVCVVLEKKAAADVWSGNEKDVPKNNCTKWFDYARIESALEFRHPQEGDYLLLDREGKRKKLSRLLIDFKMPAEQRKRIWVLAEGKHIIWIPELNRSSAESYVDETTTMMLCASYQVL